MILAAGLGTRLQPLSALCAKPAMPVRGIPVIAYTLRLLARHGVSEVLINLHHLPQTIREAVEGHCPTGLDVVYSHEETLLGTGGSLKAVADFLRESDPSIILAGDMLLDVDLSAAVDLHRRRRDRYTLLLRSDDPRADSFGTIGFDESQCVRRIGDRFDLGGETDAALFTGVRIAAARAMSDFPIAQTFEDLTDWQGPALRRGARDIRADRLPFGACVWEPVGTPAEYLAANLHPPALSYRAQLENGRRGEPTRTDREDVVVGPGAVVPDSADLQRVVVWAGERVPAGLRARDGVFAGGRFHRFGPTDPIAGATEAGKLRDESPQGSSS